MNIKNPLESRGSAACLSFKNALRKVGQWAMSKSADRRASRRPKFSIRSKSVASLICYVQLHQPVLKGKNE